MFKLPCDTSPLWECTQSIPTVSGAWMYHNLVWGVDMSHGQDVTLMALVHAPSRRICFLVRPDEPCAYFSQGDG